jgi:hypothetical protein
MEALRHPSFICTMFDPSEQQRHQPAPTGQARGSSGRSPDSSNRFLDWLHPRAKRDAWVIAVSAAPCFAVAAHFDLFERFRHLAHVQEAWQLDELVVTGFLLGMAALLFSIRRV